jgi:hypothetical protein
MDPCGNKAESTSTPEEFRGEAIGFHGEDTFGIRSTEVINKIEGLDFIRSTGVINKLE